MRVSFTHPLENYFRIERYEILYGNVDDRTVTAVSLARESYEFLMDKCVSDQVITNVCNQLETRFLTIHNDTIAWNTSEVDVYKRQTYLS